jgi:hypothetical protein
VPRRDCSARRGRSPAPACNRAGGDHHAARRVANEEEHLAREGATEAASRLDGRAHDDEFRSALRSNARHVLAEAPGPCPHDLAPDADAVRARYGRRGLEPLPELAEPAVHVRVQRQLALDDERRDEDDAGVAIGREATGEIERMLRLLPVEQRHDDAAVGDRARPPREAPRTAMEEADVGQLHRKSWYGTEARITFGSTSSSRFT